MLRGPLLTGLILLIGAPVLGMFALSLFAYDGLSAAHWNSVGHWQKMLNDPLFRQSLGNSLLLAGASVPLRLLLALGLALLLARGQPGAGSGLMLTLAPMMVPPLVWVTAWVWLLNPDFGPVAALLESIEPRGSLWLLSVSGSRSALSLVLALMAGEMVLILLVARKQIPVLWYEVAAVEGMSGWAQFRRMTLPALAPPLLLLTLRDFALTFQSSFLPAQIITKGGPNFATYMLPQYVFENSFEYLRFGYAAALSSAMLAVVVLIVVAQLLVFWRWQSKNHSGRD